MSLRVVSSGRAAGPAIAFLHGWGLGSGVWDGVVPRLETDFRIHRLSLPGYDGSPADDRDFAQTAAAVADALPAGTTLCGWSLGGLLALAAAAARPRHFARLALVGTTPKFVQADGWPHAQAAASHAAFTGAVATDAAATLTRFVRLFSQGDDQARAVTRSLSPLLADSLPATATLLRGLDWLATADLRPTLAALDLPTLLLHGDHDPLMPIAAAEAAVGDIAGARLQRFAGCAHAPFVSAADDFVAALTRFCHQRPRPAAGGGGSPSLAEEVAQRLEGSP